MLVGQHGNYSKQRNSMTNKTRTGYFCFENIDIMNISDKKSSNNCDIISLLLASKWVYYFFQRLLAFC